jgi:hypothetical protein
MFLLFALTVLTGCSDITSAVDASAVTEGTANYRPLILAKFKEGFKDFATFTSFEMSDPRFVHSMIGPVWLTCVRFETQKQRRYYVFSIQNNQIVGSRYEVQTDECGKQSYMPVDLAAAPEKAAIPAPPKRRH